MAFTYYMDPDINCAVFKFYGAYEMEDTLKAAQCAINDPAFKVGMNFLRDNREQPIPSEVTFKYMSDTAKGMIAEFDKVVGNCKTAIVVADAVSYAKIHQFIVTGRLSDKVVNRKAFRDMGKAMKWLDIPEDYEFSYPKDA